MTKFSAELDHNISSLPVCDDPVSMVRAYDITVSKFVDTHAPLQRKIVLDRHLLPWVNTEILEEKKSSSKT